MSCESPLMLRRFTPSTAAAFRPAIRAFVLCYVVGDLFSVLETELYGIVELVLSRIYEHCAGPCAMSGECPVEVHDPAVRCLASRGKRSVLASLEAWRLCPFCHEICKCGSLDDSGRAEF